MTYKEIHDYVAEQLKGSSISEDDWRPASDMYIEDLVKIIEYEGKEYVSIPMGIRIWLKNGDSIIYVKKQKDI